ncbi:MAG: dephospho-CoA kinase [Clostridiales bacterium]|nr:MAG: dephospho-CoA kinase [Clostridiales bacterium]
MIDLIIGLTGFSGAGKSTVASIFAEYGFTVLNCDKLVHEQVYRDPQVLKAVAAAFGRDCLQGNALNRAVLRARTLGNPEETARLNQTVMPYILNHIEFFLSEHSGRRILLDAPLLFESGLHHRCDKVICVVSSQKEALRRIIRRDQLTPEEARRRLSSQHSAEYYTQRSDYIINNNEGISALRKQALEILNQINDQAL